MEPQIIALIILLLILSAFFSSSETAFFSIPKWRIKLLSKQRESNPLIYLLSKPIYLIGFLVIGNDTVNVLISAYSSTMWQKYDKVFGSLSGSVGVIITTLIIFIFGEMIPKVYASKNPTNIAKIRSVIIKPILFPFYYFSNFLPSGEIKPEGQSEGQREHLLTILHLAHGEQIITEEEKRLLEGLWTLSHYKVGELMVHRSQMPAVSEYATVEEINDILKRGENFLVVYENQLEAVKGKVDILTLLNWNRPTIKGIKVEPISYVYANKPLNEVIPLLERDGIILITDEYGGISGYLTRKRLINLFLKQDDIIQSPILPIEIDGTTKIEDIESMLNIYLGKKDFKTLAGLFLDRLKRIPHKGEIIIEEGFVFEVIEANAQRVVRVRISRYNITYK